MAFDYKNPTLTEILNKPENYPEFEDEANELLIKIRGEFPYDSVALLGGLHVLRFLLKTREAGGNITDEQLEDACRTMF